MPKYISFSINPDSLDPSNLRPPLTELDTNQYLILDSSVAITLMKHKAILHNLRPSNPNYIIIFSCFNTPIQFSQEADLILKAFNHKHIQIHACQTPLIGNNMLFTAELCQHNLYIH